MIEFVEKRTQWFSKPRNMIGLRLLRIALGVMILTRFITEAGYASVYYNSVTGFALDSQISGLEQLYTFFFNLPLVPNIFWMIWAAAALSLILNVKPTLGALVALLCFTIDSERSVTQDGGDNLARILLFYLLFTRSTFQLPSPGRTSARTYIHNMAALAIYLQVAILYLISATAKLDGQSWINGTALYYVLQTSGFGPPFDWMRELVKNAYLVTFGTYATIVYQVAFPFMLLNRLHFLWVLIGIGMHIGIALIMGLLPFGIIMTGAVLYTVRDSEWTHLRNLLRKLVPNLPKPLTPLLRTLVPAATLDIEERG